MYQAQRPRCGSFALSNSCGADHSHYPSYDGSSQAESEQSHTPLLGGGTHQGHFGACCGGGLVFKVSQVLSWRVPPLLPISAGLVMQVVPQVNVKTDSMKLTRKATSFAEPQGPVTSCGAGPFRASLQVTRRRNRRPKHNVAKTGTGLPEHQPLLRN